MARKLTTILAGASAAALLIGLAMPASAQTQQPGFFGYLQGWYWLDSGNDDFRDAPVSVSPDDGFGGKAYLGYQFGNGWDVATGFQYSDLSRGKKKAGNSSQNGDYWAGDLEFGNTFMWNAMSIRPHIGARYAEFDHTAKGFGQKQTNDWYGFGPRLGFDTSVRLGDSRFSIFGGAAGSYLFGKMTENNTSPATTSARPMSGRSTASSASATKSPRTSPSAPAIAPTIGTTSPIARRAQQRRQPRAIA